MTAADFAPIFTPEQIKAGALKRYGVALTDEGSLDRQCEVMQAYRLLEDIDPAEWIKSGGDLLAKIGEINVDHPTVKHVIDLFTPGEKLAIVGAMNGTFITATNIVQGLTFFGAIEEISGKYDGEDLEEKWGISADDITRKLEGLTVMEQAIAYDFIVRRAWDSDAPMFDEMFGAYYGDEWCKDNK